MPEHLTAEQVTSFKSGTLPYHQWERAFRHMETCAVCKEAVFPHDDQAQFATDLLSKLQSVSNVVPHLESEDFWAHGSGDYSGRDRQRILQHLKICEQCRFYARELSEQRVESGGSTLIPRRTAVPWRIAVPALGLIAGLVALFIWIAGSTRVETAGLSEADARVVKSAVASRRIDLPAEISALRGTEGVLLGREPRPDRVQLIRPLGTAVASQTPRFEWTAVPGAEYQVQIFANDQPVESSPWIQNNTWLPSRSLQRSTIYTWELTVRNGKNESLAPAPREPEARFLVSQERDADSAARLMQEIRSRPVPSAILLAHLGFADDARSVLDGVLAGHPQNDRLVRSLRDSLDPKPKR